MAYETKSNKNEMIFLGYIDEIAYLCTKFNNLQLKYANKSTYD